jgi:predicted MFS family arabinose efflux permease
VAAGGAAGALFSAPFTDYLGRKWSMMFFGFLYLLGCTFQEFANYELFLAGRFIAGVAIGAMSAGAPQCEFAPNFPERRC